MFKLCFTCKNFCFDGYYCWCKKGKYPKIGFLTVNPIFFVRNIPDSSECNYSLQFAGELSSEMVNIIKQKTLNKKKPLTKKHLKSLVSKAKQSLDKKS